VVASTVWQPPPRQVIRRRGRQRLTATVAAIVFALSGTALIGVAIASQRRAPTAPALTVAAANPPQAAPAAPAPAPPRPRSGRGSMGAAQLAATPAGQASAREDSGVPDSSTKDSVVPAESLMTPSKPVSIVIPAIDVRSVVRHLGQAANGSLEVPSGAQYNDAAWYRHSPTPGALGPAVILGHVDSAAQGPSVFFRLGELRSGHRVTVTRADGSVAVFVVDAVHRYAKKDFPTTVVYSDIDHAGLRILTCGGAFDDAAGSYLDNIVVFASLVDHKG
jgi:sortase (surface protein transpeptidase)